MSKSQKIIKDGPKKKQKFQTDMKPQEMRVLKIKDPSHPDQEYHLIRYRVDFTREEIRQFAQKKSNEIKKESPDSAVFSVALRFEGGIYRSGKRKAPGEEINLWDTADSDEIIDWDITGFDLLVSLPKPKEKGKSKSKSKPKPKPKPTQKDKSRSKAKPKPKSKRKIK